MAKLTTVQKAAKALATADGVAHVAFFSLFAFRVVSGAGPSRLLSLFFALLAGLGLVLDVVGWALVRHGGRTRASRLGFGAIAASTALASVLLLLASATGG
jgi:hypothetical protein